jgi:chromosome segregation ATPase
MYTFPYKFENVNPLTFLDRFGILVRVSVFVCHISRTHRARNLKELVRKEAGEHCTGAKVRVTLLNGGDDGFQQNVYGDLVTVERNISLRTSSGAAYRILDEHGVCRSTSKKDLDCMLDQLNIQVGNPVAVLDQEEAKKFLTRKAQDKYQLFAKATKLERMDHSYANVVDNITELEENKKKVQDSLQSSQSGQAPQVTEIKNRLTEVIIRA